MRNSDLSEDMKRQLNEVITIDHLQRRACQKTRRKVPRNKTGRLLKLPWEVKRTSLKLDSQFARPSSGSFKVASGCYLERTFL